MKTLARVVLALMAGGGMGCDGGASRVPDVRPPAADTPRTPDSPAAVSPSEVPAPGPEAGWMAGDTAVAGADGIAVMRAVRTARHEEFDRIVFEFDDILPGYRVSYLEGAVRQCGSGDVVAMEGEAWLSLVFEPSAAHTEEGRPTIEERSRRPGLPGIIDFRLICDFEGQVEWVAGVRRRVDYRVLTLRGPARVVVDLRHGR